eukprot:524194-Amphidinium_carterae.1
MASSCFLHLVGIERLTVRLHLKGCNFRRRSKLGTRTLVWKTPNAERLHLRDVVWQAGSFLYSQAATLNCRGWEINMLLALNMFSALRDRCILVENLNASTCLAGDTRDIAGRLSDLTSSISDLPRTF